MSPKKTTPQTDTVISRPIRQTYLIRHLLPLIKTKGHLFTKYGEVLARKATKPESITTTTSSGIETSNTAHKGDYVVTNNNTDTKEIYVISPEKFKVRYKKIKAVTKDTTLYQPMGQVLGIRLTKKLLESFNWPTKFYIMASWKEKQFVSQGDYLVCPKGVDEVYRIGYKEFKKTYKISE